MRTPITTVSPMKENAHITKKWDGLERRHMPPGICPIRLNLIGLRVAHAAVYLIGAFSNSVLGIEGAITLGLAHAFVSSGLFICVGGVMYDRTHTRLFALYRGMAQLMPFFSILFFILCLGNMGTPLT